MPFKLKLKKSKQQYNVASKSMFVITVELLDNAMLECTLTAESTGRDCMDNVCQRLGLQQADLFGLRYASRRSYPKIRWVDLDRPLKKQLDKYAQEPYLYLSVMFYVNDVSLLEDEVTRYHYFLQLKLDVIQGRLRCNYEQAIVLASYSLQAEFGDHDVEKHTPEYLQDFPLLPKNMLAQFTEEKLGTLTEAIINQHNSLRGIAQQLAEVYYIVGAQQLDGYGQECFLAKDESGNEVLIGASITGIVVRKGNVLSPQFFKWYDITNLVNHKRYFGIECQNYEYSAQFLLDEPDSAKYVWKMCVLQHTFYKMHASASESNELNITLENSQKQQSATSAANDTMHQFHVMNLAATSGPLSYATSIHHPDIQSFQKQSENPDCLPLQLQGKLFPSTGGGARVDANHYMVHMANPNLSGEAEERMSRPVPDYETAVRNKYGHLSANILSQSRLQVDPVDPNVYSSQNNVITAAEEIPVVANLPTSSSTIASNGAIVAKAYPTEMHYAIGQGLYASTPELDRIGGNHLQYRQHPRTEEADQENELIVELRKLNPYEPPPPYQRAHGGRLASTSTPDLAGNSALSAKNGTSRVGLGGSSPDLVSKRNLSAHWSSSHLDPNLLRTFNDLHKMELKTGTNDVTNKSAGDLRFACSSEELNTSSVYKIDHGRFLTDGQVPARIPTEPQYPTVPVAKSPNLANPISEPIYENQRGLASDSVEPIYQNLPPVHEKDSSGGDISDTQMIETFGTSSEERTEPEKPLRISINQGQNGSVKSKPKGHVSRVSITNSRENLQLADLQGEAEANLNYVYREKLSNRDSGGSDTKNKLVTKVGAGNVGLELDSNQKEQMEQQEENHAHYQQVLSASRVQDTMVSKVTMEDPRKHVFEDSVISKTQQKKAQTAPRTPGSKPRAGRKRWALNFGNKTGSLKSVKSDSGSHTGEDSLDESNLDSKGSSMGFGPMMLATLHGLTRSRPDLLAESMASFSQPSKLPKYEIGAFLESKLEGGEVLREFERIPKKKLHNCHFNVATQAENLSRNRFKDVLPYDENRVKLFNPDKDNKAGFINASHLSASVGPDQRFYIAAQGPLPNTIFHFWQMICQCDVHLIVMLTDVSTSTKSTSNCIPYWPRNDGTTLELGEFKIVKKFSNPSSDGSYTTSNIHVTHVPSKKQSTVWHLQYAEWSDNGCPTDVQKFIEFLKEVSALRQHTASEMPPGRNCNPPVLVHCSAGVGRTGVTILCDILLHYVDHSLDIDIPKVLTHLRQQRMLMVQTIAQYQFVHKVLIHYLKQSRLI